MSFKRIAIGFAVSLTMAICLSLVSAQSDQNNLMLVVEKNQQSSAATAQ